MARGLITRAVPGTETGSEIALKHCVFTRCPECPLFLYLIINIEIPITSE